MTERELGYIDLEISRLEQARRLIAIGVHTVLDMSEAEYERSLPHFDTVLEIPDFNDQIIVETRVGLSRLMRMGGVFYQPLNSLQQPSGQHPYIIQTRRSEFDGLHVFNKADWNPGFREARPREAVNISIQKAGEGPLYINMHERGVCRYYLKSNGHGKSTLRRQEYHQSAYCR